MKTGSYRIEHDSMGELQVPKTALWGAQTQRAVENFPISGLTIPNNLIHALGHIKAAAAEVNADLGLLDNIRSKAIQNASQEVASGQHDNAFPVDVFQTGSGTSSNMNANEVIARLANRQSGKSRIHPNDHVNIGQSSNDVIPTAIQISAAISVKTSLLPSLKLLRSTIDKKARNLDSVIKTGRTHLMDAMPVTLAQELSAWSQMVSNAEEAIKTLQPHLQNLPLGGTAVGSGINTHPLF